MSHVIKQVKNRLHHDEQEMESKSCGNCVRESRDMRENLTEKQIDKTLEDSFPASDPPAWY